MSKWGFNINHHSFNCFFFYIINLFFHYIYICFFDHDGCSPPQQLSISLHLLFSISYLALSEWNVEEIWLFSICLLTTTRSWKMYLSSGLRLSPQTFQWLHNQTLAGTIKRGIYWKKSLIYESRNKIHMNPRNHKNVDHGFFIIYSRQNWNPSTWPPYQLSSVTLSWLPSFKFQLGSMIFEFIEFDFRSYRRGLNIRKTNCNMK